MFIPYPYQSFFEILMHISFFALKTPGDIDKAPLVVLDAPPREILHDGNGEGGTPGKETRKSRLRVGAQGWGGGAAAGKGAGAGGGWHCWQPSAFVEME